MSITRPKFYYKIYKHNFKALVKEGEPMSYQAWVNYMSKVRW